MFGQLDFAHATCTNCLAQSPLTRVWGSDGGPPLGLGGRLGAWPAILGGYSIGMHCGSGRGVRGIPRMASPAGFGTGGSIGSSVLRLAATGTGLVGNVALFVITAGNVGQIGLLGAWAGVRVMRMGGGACGGRLRAMRTVCRSHRLRTARGAVGADDSRRRGSLGSRHGEDVWLLLLAGAQGAAEDPTRLPRARWANEGFGCSLLSRLRAALTAEQRTKRWRWCRDVARRSRLEEREEG